MSYLEHTCGSPKGLEVDPCEKGLKGIYHGKPVVRSEFWEPGLGQFAVCLCK